jgi:uncharacterized protein (TIGR02996 family)
MATDETFLSAVLANPDDDGPRLVYADWLDEQGQCERAEFIRTQIDLARRPEDDPRRPDLEARERQLLVRHSKNWARPVRKLANGWEYRRGFVEHVRVAAAEFPALAEELFRAAPVRSVRLSTVGWPRAHPAPRWEDVRAALAASPYPARLTGLDFGEYWISAVDLRAWLRSPYWPRLRSLTVRGWFGLEGAQLLADSESLSRLTELDLSNSPLDAASVRALAGSPYLQQLTSLRWCRCPPATQTELLGSPLLARLRHLDLSDCQPAAVAPQPRTTFAALRRAFMAGFRGRAAPTGQPAPPSLSGLTVLRLARSLRDAASFAWFTRLVESRELAGLTTLDLGGNPRGPIMLELLLHAGPWPRLTTLHLDRAELGDTGARFLAQWDSFPALTSLYLRNNGIGSHGVAALASSQHLGRLRTLDLHGNPIGGAGLRALLASGLLTRLYVVDLSNTGLTDEDVLTLVEAPDWPRLALLRLRGRRFRPETQRALRERFGPAVIYGGQWPEGAGS